MIKSSKILIIGTGSIGERHLRCFQTTGHCDVGIYESNRELANRVAGQYQCQRFDSMRQALGEGNFVAAVICAPAHVHVPLALQCVRHGLNVLIEKPLAVSLAGVSKLERLAKKENRIVRIAFVHRSNPVLIKLRELVTDGRLGEIKHISVQTGHHFPTARPAYREIYYASHQAGGGAIQDALTHSIHAVEWAAGPLRSVFCSAAHQVLAGVVVEDTVNLVGELEGGILVSFALNQFQTFSETTFTFHGTKGSARAELHNARVGHILQQSTDWHWEVFSQERDSIMTRQAEAFLSEIKGNGGTMCTLEEATQSLRVSLAALKSVKTRREVMLNPLRSSQQPEL